MNGRVYDPTLGRFLSADPHIQSPYSTQSYNRYSYVSNNPLKYTDPSGYFLGGLFKAIGKAFKAVANFVKKYWRQIVSIVIMVYLPGYLPNWGPMLQGAVTGAVAGFVSTGSLKGAVMGGISGAAFGALHGMDGGALGSLESFKKIAAHGLVGGITGKMQGGKFGHGFLSAAFSQAAAIGAKGAGLFKETTSKALKAAERAHNAIVAGVIGGTASVLGGGKFMNGAVTGAYSQLLNDSYGIPEGFEVEADVSVDVDAVTTFNKISPSTNQLARRVDDFFDVNIDDNGSVSTSLSVNGKNASSSMGSDGWFDVMVPVRKNVEVGFSINHKREIRGNLKVKDVTIHLNDIKVKVVGRKTTAEESINAWSKGLTGEVLF